MQGLSGTKQQKHAVQGGMPTHSWSCPPAGPNNRQQSPTGRQAWLERALGSWPSPLVPTDGSVPSMGEL